jgi:hypothetical protein
MSGLRALAVLVLGGCSFLFVQGPPEHHDRLAYFDCTTSRLGPWLDVGWTAFAGLTAAAVASQTKEEYEAMNPGSQATAIGLYSTFAALGLAGAIWGFVRVGQCIDAKGAMVSRLQPNTWPEVPPPAPPASAPAPPASAP